MAADMAEDHYERLVATLFHADVPKPDLHASLENFLRTLQGVQGSTPNAAPPTSRVLSPTVLQVSFTSTLTHHDLLHHQQLSTLVTTHHLLNLVINSSTTAQFNAYTLAVFDMDSTLIQQEVIDLLAARAAQLPSNLTSGVDIGAKVAGITARAMNKEIDFEASLRERVALLKGLPVRVWEELKGEITLSPGVETLVTVLRKLGIKTVVLSGGFMPLAKFVADRLGIDHVHANELAVEGGFLTGELVAGHHVVDASFKRDRLLRLAAQFEKTLSLGWGKVLAVGDGANDLPMLWAADLGVAVNAKPRVQTEAPCKLNTTSLVDVLHLMGLTSDEIESLRRADVTPSILFSGNALNEQ